MADKQRIGKVTTRAGDSGNSKLATGRTVGKHESIFAAIGAVDELNSHVGMLVSLLADGPAAGNNSVLKQVQQDLFDIGAVLAMEGQFDAPPAGELEASVETLNAALPPLTEFVLPGGGISAAQSHICRTVCRRAETALWLLVAEEDEAPENYRAAAQYLNRLSDYFFVLARTLTASAEEQWQGPHRA
jgi:cob(I)alamin adenosyltransferase